MKAAPLFTDKMPAARMALAGADGPLGAEPLLPLGITSVSKQLVPMAPVPATCGFTGFPSPAQDYTQKHVSLDTYLNINENTTWFFQADGNSMTDVGINDGDMLIVDSTATPALGDICICIAEGEYVAKIVDMVKGRPALVSANKAFKPIFVEEVTVFGVVTGRVSKFKR